MSRPRLIEAALTWIDGAFAPATQVRIDERGVIESVGASVGTSDGERTGAEKPDLILPTSALLPGMVSAHSHSFQRGLRGHGQSFPAGAGDFWTWREAMYELAGSLDVTRFRRLVGLTFDELRRAGVTTIGEFHYLHHVDGTDFGFDEILLEEAAASGIRIVLLEVFYRTGGPGQPLEGAQSRFATETIDGLLAQAERLARQTGPAQSLGLAAHSLRAARPEEIRALYREARRRGWPFHIHVEEQPAEVEEVVAAYGSRPLRLISDTLGESDSVTAVHCTHSPAADLTDFDRAGGRVCLCPTTEADLADGLPDLGAILEGRQDPCLGSDSNLRLSMSEEMRWLEWGQRLTSGRRGRVTADDGRCGARLFELATRAGAASLGLEAGRIAPGDAADFFELDLTHPALAETTPETLLDAFVFGGADEAVTATTVAGERTRHRESGDPGNPGRQVC